MNKVLHISVALALVLLTGIACRRIDPPVKTGSVTLTFTTGMPATRATTPGDGNLADGGGIHVSTNLSGNYEPDLKILIVKSDGTVADRYLGEELAPAKVTLTGGNAIELSVQFNSLPANQDYTVYALANTGTQSGTTNTLSIISPPDWDESPITYNSGDLNGLKLQSLNGSSEFTMPDVGDRMPLAATGTLHVNENGNGQVHLEMQRCLSKVSVFVKNVTGGPLTLGDNSDPDTFVSVKIGNMNPTWGWLFPPVDVVDSPTVAGDFTTLSIKRDNAITIANNDSQPVVSAIVFPGISPTGSYACDELKFSYKKSDNSFCSNTFTGLRIHDDHDDNIPLLARNQHLQIEIRIAKSNLVTFNFIVSDWKPATETVQFD